MKSAGSHPAARRLIVNADDLGLHPGINAGILRAHREGVVTTASLSPNGAAFDDAVRLLRAAPELDLGVHLTLVGEAPLMPHRSIPSLAPRGRLPGYFTTLFRRLLLGQLRLEEVELELEAQLARVCDAGLRPAHLDSHQHVHLHPSLLPLVLRLAKRFGIGAVRAAPRVVPLRGVRPALLSLFARRAARQVRRSGLRTPDVFLGVAETGRLDEARLLRLVSHLPRGTSELVCHPGTGDQNIAQRYEWGFRWDSELRGLTSPRVRAALQTAGVSLIGYKEL